MVTNKNHRCAYWRRTVHRKHKEIDLGETMTIESITNSVFKCSVISEENYGSYIGVIPQLEGTAYITRMRNFVIDPNDPMKDGFILR